MALYCTTRDVQQAGLGVDTSSVQAWEMASLIQAACAAVEAYCGTSFARQAWPLPERSGPTGAEQHPWDNASRRIYFDSFPVPCTSVTSLRIQVSSNPATGNALVATIKPADVVVNNHAGWMEVVSLNALLYSTTPTLIDLGLQTVLALLQYEAGYSFPISGETLTNASGDLQTYYGGRGFWDAGQAVSVMKNGIAQTGYVVDSVQGMITLATTAAVSDVVSASYTATIPDAVRQAALLTVGALLAQRNLAMQDLAGLTMARVGREYEVQRPSADVELPPLARLLLGPYVRV